MNSMIKIKQIRSITISFSQLLFWRRGSSSYQEKERKTEETGYGLKRRQLINLTTSRIGAPFLTLPRPLDVAQVNDST